MCATNVCQTSRLHHIPLPFCGRSQGFAFHYGQCDRVDASNVRTADSGNLEPGEVYDLEVEHHDTTALLSRARASEGAVMGKLRAAGQAHKKWASAMRRTTGSLPPIDRAYAPVWVLQNAAYTVTTSSRIRAQPTRSSQRISTSQSSKIEPESSWSIKRCYPLRRMDG